ncbi:MAG: DUF1801 domain-containing protein [Oscillospiraceae bacterium]|nr:DUF1801 domain-containing protein [Oscillospiraceae bacterium]
MTWKCPKCGRVFCKMNQDHYCIKPRTIDEYIAAREESLRPRLELLRAIIREAIPNVEERISWSMPTFWKGKNLIHFASFKRHIGVLRARKEEAALLSVPEGKALIQVRGFGYEDDGSLRENHRVILRPDRIRLLL